MAEQECREAAWNHKKPQESKQKTSIVDEERAGVMNVLLVVMLDG